jgi:hypothetical protein
MATGYGMASLAKLLLAAASGAHRAAGPAGRKAPG